MCAEHPERPALATCPRCGSFACLGCWRSRRAPMPRVLDARPRVRGAADPVGGSEQERRVALVRYARDRAATERERACVRALRRAHPALVLGDDVRAARDVDGVIPYTRTLLVGPSFAYLWIDSPDTATIAIDVLSAIGLGLLVSRRDDHCADDALREPRARVRRQGVRGCAAARVLAYRGFLLPLSTLAFHVVAWGLPRIRTRSRQTIVGLLAVAPLALLFTALRSTARMASGVGPLASLATAIVPFVVMLLVQGLLDGAIAPWMPDPGDDASARGASRMAALSRAQAIRSRSPEETR